MDRDSLVVYSSPFIREKPSSICRDSIAVASLISGYNSSALPSKLLVAVMRGTAWLSHKALCGPRSLSENKQRPGIPTPRNEGYEGYGSSGTLTCCIFQFLRSQVMNSV